MVKIRSVKPEFWSDRTIAQLSYPARLLYIGLWNIVDDQGRGRWLPKQIEGQIFPFEDVDIVGLLTELVDSGRICRYDASNGDPLFHIPKFGDHQKPRYIAESKLQPPPSDHTMSQLVQKSGPIKPEVWTGQPETVQREVEVEVEVDTTPTYLVTDTELKQEIRRRLQNTPNVRDIGALVAHILKDPNRVAEIRAELVDKKRAVEEIVRIDACPKCDMNGIVLSDDDGHTVGMRCNHEEVSDE